AAIGSKMKFSSAGPTQTTLLSRFMALPLIHKFAAPWHAPEGSALFMPHCSESLGFLATRRTLWLTGARKPGGKNRTGPGVSMFDGMVEWPAEAVAHYTAQGYWQGVAIGDVFDEAARRHAEREAVIDGRRRTNYRELGLLVD